MYLREHYVVNKFQFLNSKFQLNKGNNAIVIQK